MHVRGSDMPSGDQPWGFAQKKWEQSSKIACFLRGSEAEGHESAT